MRRITVRIPDALDSRLRHEARRRGATITGIIREALDAYFDASSRRRRLQAAGSGHSGHPGVSEQIEELLAGELGQSAH